MSRAARGARFLGLGSGKAYSILSMAFWQLSRPRAQISGKKTWTPPVDGRNVERGHRVVLKLLPRVTPKRAQVRFFHKPSVHLQGKDCGMLPTSFDLSNDPSSMSSWQRKSPTELTCDGQCYSLNYPYMSGGRPPFISRVCPSDFIQASELMVHLLCHLSPASCHKLTIAMLLSVNLHSPRRSRILCMAMCLFRSLQTEILELGRKFDFKLSTNSQHHSFSQKSFGYFLDKYNVKF